MVISADLATTTGNMDIERALQHIANALNESYLGSYQNNNESARILFKKLYAHKIHKCVSFVIGINFINVFKTNFMSVTEFYGQIVQTIQCGANSFTQNTASSGFGQVTITAAQVNNLVVNTNQQLESLFRQIGQAFSTAAIQLASL